VLPAFTGVLVRDGYAGYAHLPAVHAWCAAHLLPDLRSLSDADPEGQLWASAMATALAEANHAAGLAGQRGDQHIDADEPRAIRNHYLGALARGDADNQHQHDPLAQRDAHCSTGSAAMRI
jgi:transposase